MHWMCSMLPAVEIADDGSCLGVGCPDKKVHPRHTVHGAGVRSHLFIDTMMFTLAKQVQVEVAQYGRCILLARRCLFRRIFVLRYSHNYYPGRGTSVPLHLLLNSYVLATNELYQLITLLFHQRACLRLYVQAQQRLRVGGGHIEPPVAIVDRDTIEVIDRACILTEMLLNGFQLALDIVDMGVDLPTADPRIQRLDQFGERLVFHREQFQDEQEGDQARIGEPVVAEVEMPGMFAAEDGIVLAHLCFDIGMPYARAVGLPPVPLNQRRHAPGEDHLVDVRGASI